VTVETVLHLLVEFRNGGQKSAKDDDPEKVIDLAVRSWDKRRSGVW
jgi:hypothetical protein